MVNVDYIENSQNSAIGYVIELSPDKMRELLKILAGSDSKVAKEIQNEVYNIFRKIATLENTQPSLPFISDK